MKNETKIHYSNKQLDNIEQSAKTIFKNKNGISDFFNSEYNVKFNSVWFDTIINLCEQAKK